MGKYMIVDGSGCYGAAEVAAPLAIVSGFINAGACLLANLGHYGEGAEQGIHAASPYSGNRYLPLAETGMSALARLSSSGRLDRQNLRNYTVPLIQGRLDYAAGYQEANLPENRLVKSVNRDICQTAAACYERIYLLGMSLIEALAGAEAEDVIVVVLRQNITVLERFYNLLHRIGPGGNRSLVMVLQNYDELSSLSVRNIKRRFGKDVPLIAIPYSTRFSNAWNQSETLTYIQRNLVAGKNHSESSLIDSFRHLDGCCRELCAKSDSAAREAEVLS